MESINPTPKRRGRPSSYTTINGMQYITEETLNKEIESLEHHRRMCRERYRQKRDILKTMRPDLFGNRNNGNRRANQRALFQYGVPIGPHFLQETQENGHPSDNENDSRFPEFSLREVLDGTRP